MASAEEVSKAVSSLKPEQMFELMKQTKYCIENNPTEAKIMLLKNPQLAYTLFQAQVVMQIVDPHSALNILNRPKQNSNTIGINNTTTVPEIANIPRNSSHHSVFGNEVNVSDPRNLNVRNNGVLRSVNNRKRPREENDSRDSHRSRYEPRSLDPRSSSRSQGMAVNSTNMLAMGNVVTNHHQMSAQGQENKTELIAQVLQLTDQQINMLPPDQRQSIIDLKNQISRDKC